MRRIIIILVFSLLFLVFITDIAYASCTDVFSFGTQWTYYRDSDGRQYGPHPILITSRSNCSYGICGRGVFTDSEGNDQPIYIDYNNNQASGGYFRGYIMAGSSQVSFSGQCYDTFAKGRMRYDDDTSNPRKNYDVRFEKY